MAHIEIPSIGVATYVVSGVQPGDLKKGPGHYPRHAAARPARQLGDRRAPHDVRPAVLPASTRSRPATRSSSRPCRAASSTARPAARSSAPTASDVIATTDPTVATLTLTTCDPKYTARNRLVVYADLDLAPSAAPQPPVVDDAIATVEPTPSRPRRRPTPAVRRRPRPRRPPTRRPRRRRSLPPTTTAPPRPPDRRRPPTTRLADAFAHGWFSDDAAFAQVAAVGRRRLGDRDRRLAAQPAGAAQLGRRARRHRAVRRRPVLLLPERQPAAAGRALAVSWS